MIIEEKIEWMRKWAEPQGLEVVLKGEVGIGRECVGLLSTAGKCYPDYHWYDENYDRIDNNGEVWIPNNAYHKYECVAILGREFNSIDQLYEWCVWFNENGFEMEIHKNKNIKKEELEFFPERINSYRMVRNKLKRNLKKVLDGNN